MGTVPSLKGLVKEQRLLVMLQGYIDDSGSDGTRIPFVLAGYVLSTEKWAEFSDDWKQELEREPKLRYFKMSEAASGEGEFESIRLEFRKYKVRQLLTIIERYGPDGICAFLRWNEWTEHAAKEPNVNRHPYIALFFLLLDALVSYQKNLDIFPQKIHLDFDEQGEVGKLALQWYALLAQYFSEDQKLIISRPPTMLDDIEYMPLQAADLLAWTIRRNLDPSDELLPEWKWVYDAVYPNLWGGLGYNPETYEGLASLAKRMKDKLNSGI